jgi:hypothetical protein
MAEHTASILRVEEAEQPTRKLLSLLTAGLFFDLEDGGSIFL